LREEGRAHECKVGLDMAVAVERGGLVQRAEPSSGSRKGGEAAEQQRCQQQSQQPASGS